MKRRDNKNRVLRTGESVRKDGKYQFKYSMNGKPRFLYSWRLEPADSLPQGKRPSISLREKEKRLFLDLDSGMDIVAQRMKVFDLVMRYLATRTDVRPSTRIGYDYVTNILEKESFSGRRIGDIRISDAKLLLVKLSKEGKGYSTIRAVRGVLRPAFQMAVDDDILLKNPFGFELAEVIRNNSRTREAISREQMIRFLRFIHDEDRYSRYYEAVYILFHTGLRISEFCGLTMKDIDLDNHILNVDHQIQKIPEIGIVVQPTKSYYGKRRLPMTPDVERAFISIMEDREYLPGEKWIGGYSGFLFIDEEGLPQLAVHWEHRFNRMVGRYNELFVDQMPNITPHVCRHTYCTNMARAGMNPKTLQYLMGHSGIEVTMNVYTHLGLEDAASELARLNDAENARLEQGRLLQFYY